MNMEQETKYDASFKARRTLESLSKCNSTTKPFSVHSGWANWRLKTYYKQFLKPGLKTLKPFGGNVCDFPHYQEIPYLCPCLITMWFMRLGAKIIVLRAHIFKLCVFCLSIFSFFYHLPFIS